MSPHQTSPTITMIMSINYLVTKHFISLFGRIFDEIIDFSFETGQYDVVRGRGEGCKKTKILKPPKQSDVVSLILGGEHKEVETPIFYEIRTIARHQNRPPYVWYTSSGQTRKGTMEINFTLSPRFGVRESIYPSIDRYTKPKG